MAKLLEMAKNIVAAHSGNSSMTTDQLVATLQEVYATLRVLEKGETPPLQTGGRGAAAKPAPSRAGRGKRRGVKKR